MHEHKDPLICGHCSFKRWEHLGHVSHHIGTERMLSDAFSSHHHPLHPWTMHWVPGKDVIGVFCEDVAWGRQGDGDGGGGGNMAVAF